MLIKKEASNSARRRLKDADRRRLKKSITPSDHRGLRMLCSEEILDLEIDCDVNIAADEFM